MSITLQYPEIQVEYKIRKVKSNFCVVNPDYDQQWSAEDVKDIRYSYHVSRPTRNRVPYFSKSDSGDPIGIGLPATARFLYPETVNFIRPLQFFIHELCSSLARQSEEVNKASFASLFRDNVMMSDFAGTWSRADYINENNLPPEIVLKPMVCGGTLLKYVGESVVYSTPAWVVEGLPPTDFTGYHPNTHPFLFFRPIISVRDWIQDEKGNVIKMYEHYAEPFDDYNGNSVLPVLGVRRDSRSSTGWVNAIPKSRVRLLLSGEKVPNPFIMRSESKPNPYEGFTA